MTESGTQILCSGLAFLGLPFFTLFKLLTFFFLCLSHTSVLFSMRMQNNIMQMVLKWIVVCYLKRECKEQLLISGDPTR